VVVGVQAVEYNGVAITVVNTDIMPPLCPPSMAMPSLLASDAVVVLPWSEPWRAYIPCMSILRSDVVGERRGMVWDDEVPYEGEDECWSLV